MTLMNGIKGLNNCRDRVPHELPPDSIPPGEPGPLRETPLPPGSLPCHLFPKQGVKWKYPPILSDTVLEAPPFFPGPLTMVIHQLDHTFGMPENKTAFHTPPPFEGLKIPTESFSWKLSSS
jgi:hypothetical protein